MKAGRYLIAVLLAAGFSVSGVGEAQSPSRQQLLDLLGGNTIVGDWDGRAYTQYFDPAGSTRYREGGGPVSFGRWRIDERARYCSVWPPSTTESCYEVWVDGKRLLWKAGDRTHPSEVLDGFRF